MGMIKVLGLALYGPLAASNRYRLAQYKDGLHKHNISLEVHHLLDDNYLKNQFSGKKNSYFSLIKLAWKRVYMLLTKHNYDLIILHCELMPMIPAFLEKMLLRRPYIYDFDDAFFLRYKQGSLKKLNFFLGDKFDSILSSAVAINAGNDYLMQYAKKINKNTNFFPTVVNTDRYYVGHDAKSTIFTIGWIGSPSTSEYLEDMIIPLSELGKKIPILLLVIGGSAPQIENITVQSLPWSEDQEISLINQFDVGVMPLPDTDWARGKCAFKLLQYMACGLPVVASKVGANIDVVNANVGFLAHDTASWISALAQLYENPSLRKKLGSNGRALVEKKYSLSANLPILVEVIQNAVKYDDMNTLN